MASTRGTSELFDWLTDEQLAPVTAKLRQLPTGSEFERRVEEAISRTVDIEDRTYDAIHDDHGDLVGYADQDTERLPWWLEEFEWTVTADPLSSLTIDKQSLDQFEDYPIDSTRIESISLSNADSVIDGLDAFSAIEETLSDSVDESVARLDDEDLSEYALPEKLFVVPEGGRIATTDAFQTWFERLLNLCPPGSPELTALLRVNTNVQRQHAGQVLDEAALERLSALSVVQGDDASARSFNETLHEHLTNLLEIESPFDLVVDVGNDKRNLSDLQYAYYRGWAQDMERISNEQQWLRKAQNRDKIEEGKEYRLAEYAFRLPIRLSNSKVTFVDQAGYGNSQQCEDIGALLEEFGHPVNDD